MSDDQPAALAATHTESPEPGESALLSPFSQTIGRFLNMPVTDWDHFFSPQIVFAYNPQDVGVEGHVLGRVGSYGHQLGQLIDMVGMLRDQLVPEEMPAADGAVVTAFDRLRQDSQAAVEAWRARPPATSGAPAPQPAAPNATAGLPDALGQLLQWQLGALRAWAALFAPGLAGLR